MEEIEHIGSSSKMNILSVAPWDQEFGGVASVVGNLASYLRRKNHKVIFLHPGSQNMFKKRITKWGFVGYKMRMRAPIVKNHAVRSFFSFIFFLPLTLLQITYIIWKHKIKIINVHYPLEEFFYFAICGKILGIKLVTSIHGADFFPQGNPIKEYPMGLKLLLSSSDCIISPSKAYLIDFLNLFPSHASKGYVIHNGVDIAEMKNCIENNKTRYAKKFLLCIAAHNEKKGIDILLHAVSQIKVHNMPTQLFLVGDGPLRQKHEELAKSLGICNQVTFFGECGRSDVVNLLNQCELLILPSRSEPFGIVLIEAMACQKPVVATMVGGIPEIIDNGKNGILVEPDNSDSLCKAICSIIQDDIFKDQLAAHGYEKVCSNFLQEHTGAKYETLFFNLINHNINFSFQLYDSTGGQPN